MFFNSIRWRLQIWYGLILVAVLAALGFTAYQLERGSKFGRIDDELQRRVGAVASALRQPPRNRGPNGPGPDEGPPPEDQPPEERFRPERPFNDGPPDQPRRGPHE